MELGTFNLAPPSSMRLLLTQRHHAGVRQPLKCAVGVCSPSGRRGAGGSRADALACPKRAKYKGAGRTARVGFDVGIAQEINSS